MSSSSSLGFINKDRAFSNLTAIKTITVPFSFTNPTPLPPPPVVVDVTEIDTSTAAYSFAPSARKTVYKCSPLHVNTTMNMSVDSSNSQLGDVMVWLIFNDKVSSANVSLSSDFFVVEGVGVPSNVKVADYWIFNGTKWGFTIEHC